MPSATTLPIMAGLAVLGAAIGVNLGHSAVSEINPAYFSDPEDSFHSDLVPYRSPDWAQVQSAEYRAAQQPVRVGELGSGCIGCRDYPVEYVPRHDPAVDGYHHAPMESAPAPAPAQIYIVEGSPPDSARDRIQLYASYPVSSEERPAQAADPAEAPAPEPAAPTGL